MISTLFHSGFYNPIYNALVALVDIVPGSDVGIAVILVTIIIRLILLPFSISAARTQRAMKVLEPKIKELKEKYKDNKERQAIETMELYKSAQVNPFASILIVLIQLPVLFALYWVFIQEPFTTINTALLYSFTPIPEHISLMFLGLLSVSGKSAILAFLAGITQYLQAHMALNGTMKPTENTEGSSTSFQTDFQKILAIQLKYVFPFLIMAISYSTTSAIALYFITTNIVGALQELHISRVIARETQELDKQ